MPNPEDIVNIEAIFCKGERKVKVFIQTKNYDVFIERCHLAFLKLFWGILTVFCS